MSGQAVCLSAIFMPKGGRHVYQHIQIYPQRCELPALYRVCEKAGLYSLYDKESKKLLDGGVIDSSAIEDSPVASVAGAVRTEVFAIQGMTPTKVTFADMKILEDLQEAQITPPLDSEQITGAVAVPTDDTKPSTPSRPRTSARVSAFSRKSSRRFWKTGVSATAGFRSLRSSPRWKP